MDYELINTAIGGEIYRTGELICRFPAGIRVILDHSGALLGLVCVTSRQVDGVLKFLEQEYEFQVLPNEVISFGPGSWSRTAAPGMVLPS